MQAISTAIDKVMPQGGLPSGIPNSKSKTLRILENPSDSVIQNGVDAFSLVNSPEVSANTFIKAVAYLQQAYGVEYPKEKFSVLFELIKDEGWTEERFQRTLKWFLKTKYNQAWTIADWFQYGVKLYPIQWMKAEIAKMGNPPRAWEKFDRYRVDGVVVCKHKDGVELPFERID